MDGRAGKVALFKAIRGRWLKRIAVAICIVAERQPWRMAAALMASLASACSPSDEGSSPAATRSIQHAIGGEGIIAAYNFNEGSGTVAVDATGSGHDGTLEGQTTWGEGRYGGALTFNDSYVTVPDSDALDLTAAMTLMAWVRPDIDQPNWPTVQKRLWGPDGVCKPVPEPR